MMRGCGRGIVLVLGLAAVAAADHRGELEASLTRAEARAAGMRARLGGRPELADAEVYLKAARWALRYDEALNDQDLSLVGRAIARAGERLGQVEAGTPGWAARKGKAVRGFVSAVDGSVQPYGVIVPASYDASRPIRLDVVLHGSTKPIGMSELRFMQRFEEGDGPAKSAPEADWIELHPLGRVENGYRWAGETDVFEAIEAVKRAYAIDPDRVVLRGMSMGASGTWHLGLKNPDRFVALGPYCGYVDTIEFSKTPLPNFVKVGGLPAHQAKMLHLLDSVDYAANAGVVPSVACMGEKDVFFQAHEIMGRAMAKEGLTMVNLISPGTGHVIDPKTQAEQLRRIGAYASKGNDRNPYRVRFVTYSLRYSHCHWVRLLGLREHYRRAEFDASRSMDGAIDVKITENVDRFAILPPASDGLRSIAIGGKAVEFPGGSGKGLVFGRDGSAWKFLGTPGAVASNGKRPGIQGPIDDAFREPFLIVRGTGKGRDPGVAAWADAECGRFAALWRRYLRGEPRIKDDRDVTPEDVKNYHLILFGDPGSNSWVARAMPGLPATWDAERIEVGGGTAPSKGHILKLIQPNPEMPSRYVVLNSGHTFGEKEFSTLNYLLFPRLGDWAIVEATDGGKVVGTGFFGEDWK